MENNFNNTLFTAIERCNGRWINDDAGNKGFSSIYPFTTENIAGYIKEFDLKGKTLLTVGSSSDQVLNAALLGCEDITLADINPYVKYYFYLKKACILTLNLNEFLDFFCYNDYPQTFKKNNNVFNLESYNKILNTLRLCDYESYLFWDELFKNFTNIDIRNNFFSQDEYKLKILKNVNLYLKNEKMYNLLQKNIKKTKITFIEEDLFQINLPKKFDNIWLSNIGQYYSRKFFKTLVDKMNEYLNENGKMLASYLYKTTKDTKYQQGWANIYDLEKTFEILKEYNVEILSFRGVNSFIFDDKNMKDSILTYTKK